VHEMGIASSIIEAIQKEQARYPGSRARKAGVRIGEFAGVDSESLLFCFEAIVKDSRLEPLDLGIERSGGDELDLQWVELDDEVCV